MKAKDVNGTVERLKEQGIEARFYHYRFVSDDLDGNDLQLRRYFRSADLDAKPAHVAPLGGATYCKLFAADGRTFHGMAFFHQADSNITFQMQPHQTGEIQIHFCYALGRAISLGRATKHMTMWELGRREVESSPELQKWERRFWGDDEAGFIPVDADAIKVVRCRPPVFPLEVEVEIVVSPATPVVEGEA